MPSSSFYDLIKPGMVLELGSHQFNAEEITRFAAKFDPQRFHLSEEKARHALFGRLCASGWHTGSVFMRKNVENRLSEFLRVTGHDGDKPVFGPSPGLRNLGWHHPVYVGDTVTYTATILGKRLSKNRDGWGMVMELSQGHNQDGKLVISMDGAVTLKL